MTAIKRTFYSVGNTEMMVADEAKNLRLVGRKLRALVKQGLLVESKSRKYALGPRAAPEWDKYDKDSRTTILIPMLPIPLVNLMGLFLMHGVNLCRILPPLFTRAFKVRLSYRYWHDLRSGEVITAQEAYRIISSGEMIEAELLQHLTA